MHYRGKNQKLEQIFFKNEAEDLLKSQHFEFLSTVQKDSKSDPEDITINKSEILFKDNEDSSVTNSVFKMPSRNQQSKSLLKVESECGNYTLW